MIWMLCSWLNHFVGDVELVTFLSRVSYASVIGILFGIFMFALNFNKETKSTIYLSIVGIIVFIITQFTPFVIEKGIVANAAAEEGAIFGSLYVAWSILVGILALSLVATLIYTTNKSTGIKKGKITTIVALFVFTILLTLFFNLILPNLGITSFIVVGQYSTFFFALGSAWVVLQEKMFSMSYMFSIIATTFSSGVILFILSWGTQKFEQFVLDWDISKFLEPKVIIFGIFVGSIVSIFIEKLLPKIKKWSLRLFKVNIVTLQSTYDWLIIKSNENVDITLFIEELLQKLESSLGCSNVALHIKDINKIWHSNSKVKFGKDSITEYLNITKTVTNESIRNPIALVVPLYIDGNLSGVLAFGTKNNLGYFSIEEVRNIDKIMVILGITVNRYTLYKQQEDFALTLQKKISEATKELKTKNELLVQKSQQERDMIDILGHELRTPLSIARNSIDIIKLFKKQNKLTPDAFEKYIDMAQENIYREVKLLEVMLAATKIDNNKLNLEFIKVDLIDVVQDAMLGLKKIATDKGLDIKLDIPKEAFVLADRTRIQEIVDNLIDNAIKYTFKGKVSVTVAEDRNDYRFTVEDTGVGMSKLDLDNLGKKFYRANNYIKGDGTIDINIVRPGGTGLGLYVTFGLIKAMGGDIKVESHLGEGSRFDVTFKKFDGKSTEKHNIEMDKMKEFRGKA
jgi:signal transduction histidine kinase